MIQHVKEHSSTLLTNKKLFIHVVVISILAGVAIWDAATIIQSFIKENRLTLVKMERVTGTFPYLEHETIEVHMWYKDTIFSEIWNDTALQESMELLTWGRFNCSRIVDRLLEHQLDNVSQLSLAEKFCAAEFFSETETVDTFAAICMLPSSNPYCSRVNRSHISNFLTHKKYVRNLYERIWQDIKPITIANKYVREGEDMYHGVSVESIWPNMVTVNIELSALCTWEFKANSPFSSWYRRSKTSTYDI